MVRNIVENYVVLLVAFGEIFLGVIDYVIRAEGLDQLDISRAANAGHFRAVRLGDLNCECADTAGSTVDQHFLTGLDFASVTNTLKRGDARNVDRCRLLKGEARRFRGN